MKNEKIIPNKKIILNENIIGLTKEQYEDIKDNYKDFVNIEIKETILNITETEKEILLEKLGLENKHKKEYISYLTGEKYEGEISTYYNEITNETEFYIDEKKILTITGELTEEDIEEYIQENFEETILDLTEEDINLEIHKSELNYKITLDYFNSLNMKIINFKKYFKEEYPTEYENSFKMLKELISKKLKDDSWGKEDYFDTIDGILEGEVTGIFFLDGKLFRELEESISKINKKITKQYTKINKLVDYKEETKKLLELQEIKLDLKQLTKENMYNFVNEDISSIIKLLDNLNTKKLSKKVNTTIEEFDIKIKEIKEKIVILENKLSQKLELFNTLHPLTYMEGSDEKSKGEYVDLIISDNGRKNQYNQTAPSNGGYVELLELLGKLEEYKYKQKPKLKQNQNVELKNSF